VRRGAASASALRVYTETATALSRGLTVRSRRRPSRRCQAVAAPQPRARSPRETLTVADQSKLKQSVATEPRLALAFLTLAAISANHSCGSLTNPRAAAPQANRRTTVGNVAQRWSASGHSQCSAMTQADPQRQRQTTAAHSRLRCGLAMCAAKRRTEAVGLFCAAHAVLSEGYSGYCRVYVGGRKPLGSAAQRMLYSLTTRPIASTRGGCGH
jgi:hypothetical protein